MQHPDIQARLAMAERQVQALSQALLQGQPQAAENAARALQQAALDMAQDLREIPTGDAVLGRDTVQRLRQVAQAIAMQRDACARRTAAVERTLHSIMPAARATTYAGAAGPYARNAKQSGAFKLLAA